MADASRFSPAELEKLLAAIAAIAATVDTIGGNLTMRYAAIAVTATREPSRV